MPVVQWIEHNVADVAVGGSIPLGHAKSNLAVAFDATHKEGWQSGQSHEFRKLEGAIPAQVRILYPPLLPRRSFNEGGPVLVV